MASFQLEGEDFGSVLVLKPLSLPQDSALAGANSLSARDTSALKTTVLDSQNVNLNQTQNQQLAEIYQRYT